MAKTVASEQPTSAEPKKPQSAGFPFFDFNTSLVVPQLIHSRGGGIAELDQLAAWLDYKSTGSGTFASKLASARYFGLISGTERGRVAITDRSRLILAPVMPEDAANAKAEAFLGVPLFKKVFEQFRGSSLPPEIGLRNLFQNTYQVPADRAQHAVRVFRDSAQQTGFFNAANDRLIRPSTSTNTLPFALGQQTLPPRGDEKLEPEQRSVGIGGGDGCAGIHAAILGLLRELPEQGQAWTAQDQKGFIDAFTAMVKFIYPTKGESDGV